jgi:hypothetical protein
MPLSTLEKFHFVVPYGLTANRVHGARDRVDNIRLAFFDCQVNGIEAECTVGISYAT